MNVRLHKASDVTLYSGSDARNIVDTPGDSQFDVSGALQTGVGDQRFFLISLQRIHPNNPNRHIRTVVAGYDFSGSVSATGLVNINCP